MAKALILDFGGVFFLDKDTHLGPSGKLANNEIWADGRLGNIDDTEIFQMIADENNVSVGTVKNWLLSRREPNEKLIEQLEKLDSSVRVAILNNGLPSLFYEYLDKYDLQDKFDVLVQSAEVGMEKPDKQIYLLTAKQLGVDAVNCIFLDDNQINVEGARNARMQAELYTGQDITKYF